MAKGCAMATQCFAHGSSTLCYFAESCPWQNPTIAGPIEGVTQANPQGLSSPEQKAGTVIHGLPKYAQYLGGREMGGGGGGGTLGSRCLPYIIMACHLSDRSPEGPCDRKAWPHIKIHPRADSRVCDFKSEESRARVRDEFCNLSRV